jgi:O-antigen biosynthesis protein
LSGATGQSPRSNPSSVGIIIPAYRNTGLEDCLRSLERLGDDGVRFEVFVILNDATPEVVAIAQRHSSDIHVVDLPMNLGTGGAFNHGFGLAKSEYLVTLQDDAEVESGWLRHLVDRIESAPDIGAVGGLVMDLNGDVYDAGWVVWRDGSTDPVWLGVSRSPDLFQESRAIDYHGSVGLIVRREAWESVSGFDDRYYPAYHGDTDFCERLRQRGWRVIYEPKARVRHAISMSSTQHFRAFVGRRNRQLFLETHADAISDRGTPSGDPADVAREVARAAGIPERLRPDPPTASELALLRQRMSRSPGEILRRERDLWVDFATSLLHELQELKRECDIQTTAAEERLAVINELKGQTRRRLFRRSSSGD